MLVVSNTKELERYGLDNIKDDEDVIVLGGLNGKDKYNSDNYLKRVTYKGIIIKKIINEMQLIESKIPNEWSKWQKAKYIYETIGKQIYYNMNRSTYYDQQSSNLSVLLSRKAVCAGYALVFKEMMDRQGIECDYIRGISKYDKHAWNILTIDGISFPVDLTWDALNLRRGHKKLQYFGVERNFNLDHIQDSDEKHYNLSLLREEFVDGINTDNNVQKKEEIDEKLAGSIRDAIEQTYKRFEEEGEKYATEQVKEAVKQYIFNRNPYYFTKTGDARKKIKSITVRKMIDFMVENYISATINSGDESFLGKAIHSTYLKYGYEQVVQALKNYIKNGKSEGFTKDNSARYNIENFCDRSVIMVDIIQLVIDNEIAKIKNLSEATQQIFFKPVEFAQIELAKPNETDKQEILKKIDETDGR